MQNFFARPAPAIVIIVAVTFLGIFKFFDLPIALYPDTSRPKLYAWIDTGSTNAEEFRELYGKQLETTLQSAKDVVRVEGEYQNGNASYTVTYDWGTSSDDAKSRARSSLATVEAQFPKEWGTFGMWFDGSEGGQALVSILSDKFSPEELAEIAEQSLKPKLSRIDGMGEAFVSRFDQKYVSISINPDALLQQKISLSEIRSTLKNYELDKGLGQLDLKEGGNYQVTARLKIKDLDSLRNAVVGAAGERSIKLRDVAAVDLVEDLPKRFYKGNGQRSLIVGGSPKPDANIKTVSDEFFAVLTKEAKAIDPDMKIKTLLNPAGFISEAVNNVVIAVVAGMLIASLVVFMFLGSLRNTLVISISIPVSLIGGFVLMYLLGIELNLISLGAMALASGMVVDGSIVVLENIYRLLDEHLQTHKQISHEDRLALVTKAVAEVRSPVIASLLTTVIVFAPLPFTSPLASAILGDLAIVMVCVLVFSVFVTLFLIPPLAVSLRLGGKEQRSHNVLYAIPRAFNVGFRAIERLFSGIVSRLLAHKLLASLAVLVIVSLVGVSGWILTEKVEREIMARPHTDKVFLFLRIKDEKIDIKQTEDIVYRYEKQVLETWGDQVSHTLSQIRTGRPWVLIFLKNKDDVTRIKKELEETFKNTPLVNVNVFDWNPTSLEIPNPPMLRLFVAGKTEAEKRELIELVTEKVQDDKNVGRISSAPRTRKDDFINIEFEPELAARISAEIGQSVEQMVLPIVGGYLSERTIGDVNIDHDQMTMKMKIAGDLIKRPADIENILVGLKGNIVPLKAIAKVSHVRDYASIAVDNGHLASVVEVWPKESFEGNKDELKTALTGKITGSSDIENSRIAFDDTEVEINENIESLADALVLSVLLILVVVCIQFGSLLQTSIIMLAVPLGFIGVSFSLWLFSSKLSVNSMLGLILLAGTAVNNSILLMDFFNRIRSDRPDMPLMQALREAVKLRFRPIMITTLTTILGMLPIAIGFGSGSEILQPLGIAVCGGLLISTVLTVVVVPLAIWFAESVKVRLLSKKIVAVEAVKVLVILIVCAGALFGASSSSIAGELNLEQAESLAQQHALGVAQAKAQGERAQAEKKGHLGKLLPKLDIGRTYAEQQVRLDDPGTADADLRLKTGVSSVVIKEEIPNPFAWRKDLSVAETNELIASTRESQARSDAISRVRVTYFQAVLAEASLKTADENLVLAKETFAAAEQRYKGGFVAQEDVLRADVQASQAAFEVEAARENLRFLTSQLAFATGMPEGEAFKLTTTIPAGFSYFSTAAGSIKESLPAEASEQVQLKELELKRQELVTERARLAYFPDLSVGAVYERTDPNQLAYEPKGPRYFVSANWNLFNGLRDYHTRKAELATRESLKIELERLNGERQVELERYVQLLKNLQLKFESRKKQVDTLETILKSSRQRFSQGHVSSKQVTDDFTIFLTAQEALFAVTAEIIKTMVEFSRFSGEPQLFHRLF